MGTRNLTMVIHKEETKIAQYGQWDGYPRGNGLVILTFLRNKKRVEKLTNKLKDVRFATAEDDKKVDKFLKSIGSNDGWMNVDQAVKYNKKYPYVSRDIGAGILELIANSKDKEIVLTDSTDFAGNSLFCEWAYVIDLDNRKLEVYEGFNREPLAEDERFAKVPKDEGEFTQVRLVKKYDLDKLPTNKEFVKELEKNDEEEE